MTAQREGQQIDTFPSQMYGWDGSIPVRLKTSSSGSINVTGFDIPEYDEVVANSMTKPTSVLFKLSGTTVATLTITYIGSGVSILRT